MGGETGLESSHTKNLSGPSPRGRGNPLRPASPWLPFRSIPAWAGKPSRTGSSARSPQVHPRVGGETRVELVDLRLGEGPSPRGRGNLHPVQASRRRIGSIPAWAGKPACRGGRSSSPGVHPRVGGETVNLHHRMPPEMGPSPRGRGNRGLREPARAGFRSIPAWAGKPGRCHRHTRLREVHPRVGGETATRPDITEGAAGPSPRGRGNPSFRQSESGWIWSIPAWAGKPSTPHRVVTCPWVHPRVGGETPR